jgi:hypothetical protein
MSNENWGIKLTFMKVFFIDKSQYQGYNLTSYQTCYDSNHDGFLPWHEKKLIQ